jgi:hypothetical protein
MAKNHFLKSLLIACSTFMIVGCGGGGSSAAQDPLALPINVTEAINGENSTLTQVLKDSITYMYNEEDLAYAVYTNIYKVQPVMQLQNIATKSEIKHMDAVDQLAIKYDLNMTQYPDTDVPYSKEGIGDGFYSVEHIETLYDLLYAKGIQSPRDALEVGCMVEVVDIEDLNRYIDQATESDATDVLTVFEFLRDGSYNHYRAFDQALKAADVTEGCCALMDDANLSGLAQDLNLTFCHDEYLDATSY